MVDDRPAAEQSGGTLPERVERALAALLAIDAGDAEQVRGRSPSRRRPRAQHGPELDLGGGTDDGSAATDAPAD